MRTLLATFCLLLTLWFALDQLRGLWAVLWLIWAFSATIYVLTGKDRKEGRTYYNGPKNWNA